MNEIIEGWKVGAVYKSESGDEFHILSIEPSLKASTLKTTSTTIQLEDEDSCIHWFDIRGNTSCSKTCTHGNLTNLVDQDTTTYKIKSK